MSFQGDSIFWVEVEKIVPNPFQPRREFDQERLRELADSIRMYGVLQPLTVTKREVHSEDGSFRSEYELIAGERRLRASKLAGVELVPVIIRSGEQTEQEKLELAIIENLQREDLNAVDRALAFKQLAEMFELSHSQVAKKVGRSREYVSNSIRLLALPEHMLQALKEGSMSEGHARTLLMLKDKPEEQEVVFREILLKKLSVREVERIARKIASDKVRKKQWDKTDAHLIELERAFTDTLGTRVQILKTEFGGKLTIDYFSENDLETLLSAMSTSQAKITTDLPEHSSGASETVIQEMPASPEPVPPGDEAMDSIATATPLQPVDVPPVPEVVTPEPSAPEVVTSAPAVSQPVSVAPAPTPQMETPSQEYRPAPQPTPQMPIKNIDLNEEPSLETPTVPVGQTDDLQQTLNKLSAAVQSEDEPVAMHRNIEEPPPAQQADTSESVTEAPVTTDTDKEEKKSEDSDLYSLKNFSI